MQQGFFSFQIQFFYDLKYFELFQPGVGRRLMPFTASFSTTSDIHFPSSLCTGKIDTYISTYLLYLVFTHLFQNFGFCESWLKYYTTRLTRFPIFSCYKQFLGYYSALVVSGGYLTFRATLLSYTETLLRMLDALISWIFVQCVFPTFPDLETFPHSKNHVCMYTCRGVGRIVQL